MTFYTEPGRYLKCSGEEKLFILFVLHEEFFCLKNIVVKVGVVGLKVPNLLLVPPFPSRGEKPLDQITVFMAIASSQ